MMKQRRQTGYVDIHSHFLPGLDDGPEDYGQCIQAAQCYIDIGVDCVIATPHCINGTKWTPDPVRVRRLTGETEKIIRDAGISLRILPGMEIAFNDMLNARFPRKQFVSLAEKGIFLIEFPMNTSVSIPVEQKMKNLLTRAEQMPFVIAHPERCALFNTNIDLVHRLVDRGILIQVNIGSVLGFHGKEVQKAAFELFTAGLVHFLATDSHARENRMPPDPRQMTQLIQILGVKTVQAAFSDNPQYLLDGEDIRPLQTVPRIHHPIHTGSFIRRFKKIFTEN